MTKDKLKLIAKYIGYVLIFIYIVTMPWWIGLAARGEPF